MPDDVLQEIMEALNKQPPAPRRTAPPPRAHAPARESIFRLMIKKDSAKDLHEVPLYMAGILKDEATCVIYQTDLCPTTRLEFLYRMSRQHLMPPGTLVQIMQPRGTIYDMEADGVLYFSPADGYSQMGQFGRIAEGYHWMAPAPAILLKWGLDPWPCLSPRQEPAPKPPKPAPQPPDEREQLRERLSGNEDAKRLLDFLEGHAVPPAPGNDEKDPGELTMGLNDKTLQDLYEYNRGLYAAEVQRELKDVIKKLSALTTRQKRRVCDLLRYAYNHKQTYTPIPAVELQRALQQTLPGQADVTDRVMAMVRAANARRQPLTLLVLDEEEETGKAIARCLQTVLPGAASLDGNLGALNLAGSEAAYDSAMMGMAVKKMEGPLLCIEAFNAIVWQAEVNKDSAAPAFTALLGSRTFTDRFLGVAIRYGGHIVALAPALELKYRQMFSQVLEVPVRTRAETVHLLQAKAQHGQPAFALSATAAERLLVAYAPGSLRRRAVPGSNGGLCRCAGPPGGGKRPGRRAGAAFADPRRAVGARLGGGSRRPAGRDPAGGRTPGPGAAAPYQQRSRKTGGPPPAAHASGVSARQPAGGAAFETTAAPGSGGGTAGAGTGKGTASFFYTQLCA